MSVFTYTSSGIDPERPTVAFMSALFAGGWIWDHPYQSLDKAGVGVLAVNEPICAVDSKVAGSINRLASEFLLCCDAAGADKLILCTNSLGGLVALEIAARHPDRVLAVAMSGTPGLTRDPDVGLGMDRRTGSTPRGEVFQERMMAALFHRGRHFSDEQLYECGQLMAQPSSMVSMARSLRATRSYPIRDKLDSLGIPVRLIWGRHDRMTPIDSWLEAVEGRGHCKVEIVEDCGHIPMLEKPDIYSRSLIDFYRSVVGGTP